MNTIAMKRLIIMILVSVCFALKLDAQQNLAISPFFDEKSVIPQKREEFKKHSSLITSPILYDSRRTPFA